MEEAKKLIEELRCLAGKSDVCSRNRIDEIVIWFKENNSEENVRALNEFIEDGIDKIEEEIESIRECIKREKIGS